jgi:hypothetical protein
MEMQKKKFLTASLPKKSLRPAQVPDDRHAASLCFDRLASGGVTLRARPFAYCLMVDESWLTRICDARPAVDYRIVFPLEGNLRISLRMNSFRFASHLMRKSLPTRVNLCARLFAISSANSFTCFLLISMTPPGLCI